MIYTVTLNPALDYVMEFTEPITLGQTNRSVKEYFYTGGKGVMVSSMLSNLEMPSTALGFLAGFSGVQYQKMMQENYEHIVDDLLFVEGYTRINPKLKSTNETELNGQGPVITATDLQQLEQKLSKLQKDDIVILAGSIAEGIPIDWYVQIAKILHTYNIAYIVDIANKTLLEILPYKPLMIKPNHHEVEDILGAAIKTEDELIAAGQKLHEMGAQHVIISRGGDGALLINAEGVIKSESPKGTVIDTVGAGDSMVAGFTYGYANGMTSEALFQFANACGSATAFSVHIGKKELVEALVEEVKIIKL